jgi:uncharacterized protein (DUF1330 family)
MPAYVIAHVRIHDRTHYPEYMQKAQDSIVAAGGKYIARGGAVHVFEGDWQPERLVILEFPSMQAARDWWHGEAYQQALPIRQAAAISQIVLTEGLDVPIG